MYQMTTPTSITQTHPTTTGATPAAKRRGKWEKGRPAMECNAQAPAAILIMAVTATSVRSIRADTFAIRSRVVNTGTF